MNASIAPLANIETAPETLQKHLLEKLAKWSNGQNRVDTEIPGLTLHRWDSPTQQTSYTLAPSFCLISQGRKQVILGNKIYEYGANRFLITSIDLPVISRIIEATPEAPYIGMTLELNLSETAQLLLETEASLPIQEEDRLGLAVSDISHPLIEAVNRLVDLLDTPQDIPILAPLIKREILYRLLMSEQGARLRQIASTESHSYKIARVIDWLKTNYAQPTRVEDLAQMAGLSSSAFHNHFRTMTAMSPVQFQKRLRLSEARRLMLTERLEASAAAFEVGYESPSQFSREYSRMFGFPPARDIKNLTREAMI